MSKLLYFRKVTFLGFLAVHLWGYAFWLYVGIPHDPILRAPLSLLLLLIFIGTFQNPFVKKNIEVLTYWATLLAIAQYLSGLLNSGYNLLYAWGFLVTTSCCILLIISRKYLKFLSVVVTILSISLALINVHNEDVVLFWLSVTTLVGISYFFGNERIKSLEILERKNIEMSSLYNTARQVAHDIRSPVMALEMVAGSLPEADGKRKDILQRAVQRINGIADDLLSSHRAMQKNITADAHKISSLNETIKNMIQEKSLVHPKIRFVFDKHTQKADHPIPVKLVDVSRILSNILNNSIEALEHTTNATIEVSTSEQANNLCILVKDNGKGVPTEHLDKIFDKGFSYGKAKGNGLGLSGAKEILDKYNGTIKLLSTIDLGTSVEIFLPLQEK